MQINMKLFLLALLALATSYALATGVSIKGYGYDVNIQSDNSKSQSADEFEPDTQLIGVTIINEKLFIDGERIPKNKLTHKSKITKKTYVIKWGPNDNISVKEQ